MFGLPTPYLIIGAIGILALSCAFSFNAGMQYQRNATAGAVAKETTRIVKETAKSNEELRAMPQADLCREINQGVSCD